MAEFNHSSNCRGERFRVLVADSAQCSEGVSFLAVRTPRGPRWRDAEGSGRREAAGPPAARAPPAHRQRGLVPPGPGGGGR
eukprot:3557027-Pyramimonas_sp.AAC.1